MTLVLNGKDGKFELTEADVKMLVQWLTNQDNVMISVQNNQLIIELK